MTPFPMRVTPAEMANIRAKIADRKEKRQEKAETLWPKKSARKVLARTLRKRLIAALDTAFSLWIRSLWKACPFCGGPVEHCFHFVTRAKYSVRWDERNAVGSCRGCNLRYEYDPHFAIAWYLANKGLPAYEDLIRRGNAIAKHGNDDLQRRLDEIRSVQKPETRHP